MINESSREISMVGLSVVLEGEESSSFIKQVMMVNKAMVVVMTTDQVSSSSSSRSSYVVVPPPPRLFSSPRHHSASRRPPVFLDVCFLCKNELLPGKDIYMYKGDRGFCSVECRCRQILMDEQAEAAAVRSSDHCSGSSRCPKITKNRDGNGSTAC